jgi:hypothetical protein
MYGNSPYGSPMNRGMFMDPQMIMMLQMRDQMRAQYAPQPTEMPQQVTNYRVENMEMPLPALGNAEPIDRQARLGNIIDRRARLGDQMPQQQQTTEQTLEQLQGNIQQMQKQQQRLSEHLGAGSGMLRQLQPQQGLGGLFQQLSSEPARMYTQGPESMRLQSRPAIQGNPFGA